MNNINKDVVHNQRKETGRFSDRQWLAPCKLESRYFSVLKAVSFSLFLTAQGITYAGSWQPLRNQPTFLQGGATAQLLLTNGNVLVFDSGYTDVWQLSPDINGSYVNGTWSRLSDLPRIPQRITWPIQYANKTSPSGKNNPIWAPLYPASAVLADGRTVICGGEDNGPNADFTLTNMCAIYDPVRDKWTSLNPPPFIINQQTNPSIENPPRASYAPNAIGDASSVVLPDGTFLLAPKMTNQMAALNPQTLEWTEVGTSTNPGMNDEQGLVLLPNGKVLTTEAYNGQYFAPEIYGPVPNDANMLNSLLFDPSTKSWASAGSTLVHLTDGAVGEVGPQILRPDGKVVFFSGTYTGQNVIYDTNTESWSVTTPYPVGPGTEGQLTSTDTGAALLPNGNILVIAGPYFFLPPTHFFEFTYNTQEFIEQPTIPMGENTVAYAPLLLVLPTGQIMETSGTRDIEIYTPSDTSHNMDWEPVVKSAPSSVKVGSVANRIDGLLFNGMSQGSGYGDDYQSATNYPLVRITNLATGHVFYSRTHDHSYMGVAAKTKPVYTFFDVPKTQELGLSILEVVTNGIPSKPVVISVTK